MQVKFDLDMNRTYLHFELNAIQCFAINGNEKLGNEILHLYTSLRWAPHIFEAMLVGNRKRNNGLYFISMEVKR